MKDKDTTPAPAPEPAPEMPAVYEVTAPGPVKIGAVLCWQGARVNLTPCRAAALNAAIPGAVRPLGI